MPEEDFAEIKEDGHVVYDVYVDVMVAEVASSAQTSAGTSTIYSGQCYSCTHDLIMYAVLRRNRKRDACMLDGKNPRLSTDVFTGDPYKHNL